MPARRVSARALATAALVALAVAFGAVVMAHAILRTAIEAHNTLRLIEEGRAAW